MNEFDDNQYNGDPEHDMWVDYDYEINTDEDVTDDAFGNFDDEDNIPENENIGNPNEIITNGIVLGIVLLCHPRYNQLSQRMKKAPLSQGEQFYYSQLPNWNG